MSKIHELCSFLEQIAPLELQESYDNAGLIYGSPNDEITGVLFSLDATEEVVNEAKSLGCNVVVSHHPIIFRGLKKISPTYYVDRSIISAIRNEIALYAIHTNLDNILHQGVNGKIAQVLGLEQIKILAPKRPDNPLEGAGIVGRFAQAIELDEVLDLIKAKFNMPYLRHTRRLKDKIQTVALCGGSGSFLVPQAIRSGADLYLSADFKYHEFFEADDKIMIVDIGHYESEFYTIQHLFELVSQNFRTFATHCTKTITNPVQYY